MSNQKRKARTGTIACETRTRGDLFKATVVIAFVISVAIIVHQVVVWNVLWEMDDFLHHEVLSALFFTFAMGVVFASVFIFKKKGGDFNGKQRKTKHQDK